jgi:BTB/POZ domain-containing protein KCTD9
MELLEKLNLRNSYLPLSKSEHKEGKETCLSCLVTNPIITTSLILALCSVLIISLSWNYIMTDPADYLRSILIEAHGMLFDVGVIGILIFWLNKRGETKLRTRKYLEEIDDIRLWKSEEATYKILGNLKRLLREKTQRLDLNHVYLQNVNLSFLDMEHTNFNYADLSNSLLNETNLTNSKMNYVNLSNTTLNKTNFKATSLNGANFSGAKGIKTNFRDSLLIKVDFCDTFLLETDFSNCDMSGANFENASLYSVDFTNAKGLSIHQFSNVKKLSKVKMDIDLLNEIELIYPHIIK